MIYKVGLLGASGRVGSEVAFLLRENYWVNDDCFELADAITDDEKITQIEGVEAHTFSKPSYIKVHVWIDFSRPIATLTLLERINVPVVIGTTGFSDEELLKIKKFAEKNPVFFSPNMSIGMNHFMKMIQVLPFHENYSAILSEEHHKHKKDAPSGTAKRIKEILIKKGYNNINLQVSRIGSIMGTHSLRFISDNEELEICHKVYNRRTFAEGALHAAAFLLKTKTPGFYGMDDLI